MLSKVGTFNSQTGSGSQAVTGVGFQPKLIILFTSSFAADNPQGYAQDGQLAIGAAASSSARFCQWGTGRNGFTMDAFRGSRSAKCIVIPGNRNTTVAEADLTSMDSDGFTLSWNTGPGAAYRIHYLALGGDDIQVKVGKASIATSGGTQSFTGVGFKPDAMLFFHSGRITEDTIQGAGILGAGMADGTRQYTLSHCGNTAFNASTAAAQRPVAIREVTATSGNPTVAASATLASFDTDGFTLTVGTLPSSTLPVGYIALKGVRARVDAVTTKTSTGTKAYTGVGFQPKVLITTLGEFTTSDGDSGTGTWANFGFGFANGSAGRAGAHTYEGNGAAFNNIGHSTRDGVVHDCHLGVVGTLSSLDSDGFTIDYTTANASARVLNYLALADLPSSARAVVVT